MTHDPDDLSVEELIQQGIDPRNEGEKQAGLTIEQAMERRKDKGDAGTIVVFNHKGEVVHKGKDVGDDIEFDLGTAGE